MALLEPGTPRDAGLDAGRLERACGLLSTWVEQGQVPTAALAVARRGRLVEPRAFGVRRCGTATEPAAADTVFLVASVTKPVTALAALLLVEEGRLSLTDRVCDVIPEFGGAARDSVRLIHLLTHTSGLPDMLPENEELRAGHADFATFVHHICQCGLLFPPGTEVRYQSMGTALVGEMVQRVTGQSLAEFMAARIFAPLGMSSTSLGLDPSLADRLADAVVPAFQEGTDWHWNSPYWRSFGAPWGGMYSTVGDLARLLQCLLDGGDGDGDERLLGGSAAATMVADQTARLGGLPPQPAGGRWGLGWRLGSWGDLASTRSFSHGGATGTLVGADPATGLVCALFTTQPGAPLHRAVTAVQAAVI